MSAESGAPKQTPTGSRHSAEPRRTTLLHGGEHAVLRLAAILTTGAVAMGTLVCATKSGAACPTWPGCRPGDLAPGWQLNPLIEFSHRVVAVSSGPFILAAAVVTLRRPQLPSAVRGLPWLALLAAIGSGAFGRLVVLSSIPTWMGAVDLTCALTAMSAMTYVAVRTSRFGQAETGIELGLDTGRNFEANRNPVVNRRPTIGQLNLAAVIGVIALHMSGIFTAGAGSFTRCVGWPLWQILDGDLHPKLQVARMALAVCDALLVVALLARNTTPGPRRQASLLSGLLLLGELGLGAGIQLLGSNPWASTLYCLTATFLLWSLAAQAALPTPLGRGEVTRGDADRLAHLSR